MKKIDYVIGIDEVGRGPLAGRVYVGCVILSFDLNRKLSKLYKHYGIPCLPAGRRYTVYNYPRKLADSKNLSEKQRYKWFSWVKKNKIIFSCAWVNEKKIDGINISNACNLAAQKAFEKTMVKMKRLRKSDKLSYHYILNDRSKCNGEVIADGSLKINIQKYESIKKYKHTNLTFKNFPKADEKVPAVSLASIVAKITRDKYITKLHKKYPQYGFDHHKGYGTKKHIEAIKKHGPSKIHRLTFIGKYNNIKSR
ncbi:MAG: ribonuclease HII [Candidatus Paceibacterota bacterium]|jgi:ribonuclease HII